MIPVFHLLLWFTSSSSSWQVGRSLPELTPSTILSACPGDEVMINCHESDTTALLEIALRWEITPMNNLFAVIELALTDMVNDTERQDLGLKFYAEWISRTPLSAILTITADLILDGATVTCASSGSAISDPLMVRVTQIADQPAIQWLNVTGRSFETDNLTVIIEWEGNSNCLDFTISLTSPTDASLDYNFTTRNISQTFNIFYNINYTVTITVADSEGNNSDEISKIFNFIKCEPPAHRKNLVIGGYAFPALENSQISVSCLPGYGLPHWEVIVSTCTSEAVWLPDLLDLNCQRKLLDDHSTIEDCGQLSSVSGAYRVLMINETNTTSYSEGSRMEFQCLHTPYELDPLFTTECQSGQWNPHPRDICSQGVTIIEYYVSVIASLGAVIAVLCLVVLGTLSALLFIIHEYRKKGRGNRMNRSSGDQLQESEVIPGSGLITPNVSYEPTIISHVQKRRVSHGDLELERNPAYATSVVYM